MRRMTLRLLTAGESHGPGLTGILEGLPAGLALPLDRIDAELTRRQQGVGRGARMQIEQDRITCTGGVRHGITLGSPVCLWLPNRDFENWQERMQPGPLPGGATPPAPVTLVRPGHIDLAGSLKLAHFDVRNTLERASARETAMRVALGTCARILLEACDIHITSRLLQYGTYSFPPYEPAFPTSRDWEEHREACLTQGASALTAATSELQSAAEEARAAGTSLGGSFQVLAYGLPPGLGHYIQWDRRLDGRLAQALMSIHAVKAVGFGAGDSLAGMVGSESNDALFVRDPAERRPGGPWWKRTKNYMGGLEGGLTNGEPLTATLTLKPLSTQTTALPSIDLATGAPASALVERTDVAVVEAAAVVAEAMVALVLADALMEQCGGSALVDVEENYRAYRKRVFREPSGN